MTSGDIAARGLVERVTITGTRATTRDRADYDALFDRFLGPFAAPTTRFYVGGAQGIDTLALRWLCDHSSAMITVAVPCTLADQPPSAQQAVRAATDRKPSAELVELKAPRLDAPAYHARNRWMVDRSQLVIGYSQGPDGQSGTWYTLDYAAAQDKPRLIVPV